MKKEAKKITEFSQNFHTAPGEAFGGGEGGGDRQLQYQVSTGHNGGFCPEDFVHNGRSAPLDKVTAHEAHNAAVADPKVVQRVHQVAIQATEGFGRD